MIVDRLVIAVSYWLRPYDMLADARRWRWQPRTRCGWSHGISVPHAEQRIADLLRSLPPPPDPFGGQVGSLGPGPEELASTIVELMVLHGWQPCRCGRRHQ